MDKVDVAPSIITNMMRCSVVILEVKESDSRYKKLNEFAGRVGRIRMITLVKETLGEYSIQFPIYTIVLDDGTIHEAFSCQIQIIPSATTDRPWMA